MGTQKTLEAARTGSGNLRFRDVVGMVEGFGFRLARVKQVLDLVDLKPDEEL